MDQDLLKPFLPNGNIKKTLKKYDIWYSFNSIINTEFPLSCDIIINGYSFLLSKITQINISSLPLNLFRCYANFTYNIYIFRKNPNLDVLNWYKKGFLLNLFKIHTQILNNNDASSISISASNNAESFDLRMKSMENQINNLSLAFTKFMKEHMFSSNTNSLSQHTHDYSDT
ncbi:hypothetical protein ACTFIR_005694 [Dictyostelium discoideum]